MIEPDHLVALGLPQFALMVTIVLMLLIGFVAAQFMSPIKSTSTIMSAKSPARIA